MKLGKNGTISLAAAVALGLLLIASATCNRWSKEDGTLIWLCLEQGGVRTAVTVERGGSSGVDFGVNASGGHLSIQLCDRKSAMEWTKGDS